MIQAFQNSKASNAFIKMLLCIVLLHIVWLSNVFAAKTNAYAAETIYGGVKIQKTDSQTGNVAQGAATFEGIEFSIVNNSLKPVSVNGVTYMNGQTVATITTDASGIAQTAANTLPFGLYSIWETKSNGSYAVDKNARRDFHITENAVIVDLTNEPFKNDVIRGGLATKILDTETKTNWAMGTGKLNATFEVINKNSNAIIAMNSEGGHIVQPEEVVATLQAEKRDEGWAIRGENSQANWLAYGTYEIREVTQGYAYESLSSTKTFIIEENTGYANLANQQCGAIENQIVRDDISITKKLSDNIPIANDVFLIVSRTTGESHVAVTNANGVIDTSAVRNSANSNDAAIGDFKALAANTASSDNNTEDVYLDPADISYADIKVDESKINSSDGVWFGLNEAGETSNNNNNLGALYYDANGYIAYELPCEANGYNPASPTIIDPNNPNETNYTVSSATDISNPNTNNTTKGNDSPVTTQENTNGKGKNADTNLSEQNNNTNSNGATTSVKTGDMLCNAILILGGIAVIAVVIGGIAFRKNNGKRDKHS